MKKSNVSKKDEKLSRALDKAFEAMVEKAKAEKEMEAANEKFRDIELKFDIAFDKVKSLI